MQDPTAWLRLNRTEIVPARQRALLERFGTPQAVLAASQRELLEVERITRRDCEKLAAARVCDVAEDVEKLDSLGLQLLTAEAPEYPERLAQIDDAPVLLFVKGELSPRDELAVALVGTRRCSNYGTIQAEKLAGDLARRGFTVVSGGAHGIDGAAHRGALEAGGRTIAVSACGLDVNYPRGQNELRERITACGAILTEVPFGTSPEPKRFPVRNRIVSGLSLGVVVIEAPSKSGALITANLALDQGREVFGVPGDVGNPLHRGTHRLIRDGAHLVETVDDVIDGLGILPEAVPERAAASAPPADLAPEEQRIIDALSFEPRHVDDVIRETGLLPAKVTATLMMLEMRSLVRRFAGNTFVRL
jgi:DNA processing protein